MRKFIGEGKLIFSDQIIFDALKSNILLLENFNYSLFPSVLCMLYVYGISILVYQREFYSVLDSFQNNILSVDANENIDFIWFS